MAGIVRAMKDFSHPGGEERPRLDLNQAIESTIAGLPQRMEVRGRI